MLAPLALLLAAAAVLVVIQVSTEPKDSKDTNAGKATTEQTDKTTRQKPRRVRPTYTVKLNDTLSSISDKTGVSVERIQTLNPDLDPQNLIVGQKIKLRE